MLNTNNDKNDNSELVKFPKLKEAADEYTSLIYEDKKEYMRLLTSWYMRQKDMLSYNQNHIK
jgi:hypothetical protein